MYFLVSCVPMSLSDVKKLTMYEFWEYLRLTKEKVEAENEEKKGIFGVFSSIFRFKR